MSGLRRIDGRVLSGLLRRRLSGWVREFQVAYNVVPKLAVILVGDDSRSQIYVRAKHRALLEVGMSAYDYHLASDSTQEQLLELIRDLNHNPEVHGILVQLPLPSTFKVQEVIGAIVPEKDVDGFHPINVGLLTLGRPSVVPCTPLGCLFLLYSVMEDVSGLHALVIGRSTIVGRPLGQLLLLQNCTVTMAHSYTKNLQDLCYTADIVIAAVGRANLVRGSWIRSGAVVLDVGINTLPDAPTRLVGDVAFSEVRDAAITPVPGGVGPMTVACLLVNTFMAACRQVKGEESHELFRDGRLNYSVFWE